MFKNVSPWGLLTTRTVCSTSQLLHNCLKLSLQISRLYFWINFTLNSNIANFQIPSPSMLTNVLLRYSSFQIIDLSTLLELSLWYHLLWQLFFCHPFFWHLLCTVLLSLQVLPVPFSLSGAQPFLIREPPELFKSIFIGNFSCEHFLLADLWTLIWLFACCITYISTNPVAVAIAAATLKPSISDIPAKLLRYHFFKSHLLSDLLHVFSYSFQSHVTLHLFQTPEKSSPLTKSKMRRHSSQPFHPLAVARFEDLSVGCLIKVTGNCWNEHLYLGATPLRCQESALDSGT